MTLLTDPALVPTPEGVADAGARVLGHGGPAAPARPLGGGVGRRLATIVGLVSGLLGGLVDMVLSRILDILWAFPVHLLKISLSIVVLKSAITIGPLTITAGGLLPIGVI